MSDAPLPPLMPEPPRERRDMPDSPAAYLDGILRRREDYFDAVFAGDDIAKHLARLSGVTIVLCVLYGVVMGAVSGPVQALATGVKAPVLYLLTLLVCYPVLYVVNVVLGSRLGFLQTLALIMLSLALNSILLASCAPIVLFFQLTGSDYHFLKLLHVAVLGFSGLWAMVALWRGLVAMCEHSSLYPRQAIRILQVWILVFALVGAQSAWSLRPFIGAPNMPFQVFRQQEGNFYLGVWNSVNALLKPDDGVEPVAPEPLAADPPVS